MQPMIEFVSVIARFRDATFEIIHPPKFMSSFNQNGQAASATTASYSEQSANILNDLADFEALIPKNVSSNKRAVIERLISLYQQNAKGH